MADVLANGLGQALAPSSGSCSEIGSGDPPSTLPATSSSSPSNGIAIQMTTFGGSDASATNGDDGLDSPLLDPSTRDLGEFTADEVHALRNLVEVQVRPRPKRGCTAEYYLDRGRRFSQLPRHPCCWLFGLAVSILALVKSFCGGGGMLDLCEEGGFLSVSAECAPLSLSSMYEASDCVRVGPGDDCRVRCAAGWLPKNLGDYTVSRRLVHAREAERGPLRKGSQGRGWA